MRHSKLEDNSPRVPQRNKIKDTLSFKDFTWTEKQKQLISLALDKKTRIIFISGPAGTSKTFSAIFCALKLLSDKRISDIIYIRSAVESSDSKIGYLPGTESDKMRLYSLPFFDKLEELLPTNEIKSLLNDNRLVIHPTNFARGMSWNTKAMIFDETQNSSVKEIVTIITRLGKFSKCFVLADPQQSDLKNGAKGGFETISQVFDNQESRENGIYVFKFGKEDIVRDEIVKFIIEKIEGLKLPQ